MDKSCYRANLPYPEVCVEHKNKFYASLLLDDYASCTSEYTAIAQYVYAHVKTEDECIQDVFLGIAIVEMCHLDLLADVILQYEKHIQQIKNCDIQRLLERIIMDEKIHVNIFKQILCELQDY